MRPAHLYSLAVPALLGAGIGLLLVAGHKDKPAPAKSAEAAVSAERRIHVQAYQTEIAKAPLGGKLETMSVGPAGGAVGVDQPAQAAPPPAVQLASKAPAPAAPAVLPHTQTPPRALAQAELPRQPVPQPRYAQPRYDQAGYDDEPPRGYRQPQMYWAADPRARRGGPYADPAPPPEVYAVAPPRAPDADTAGDVGFRISVPVCRRAAQQGDPLAETPQCHELLRGARDQQRLCQQAWEDENDEIAMSPACRQAARLR